MKASELRKMSAEELNKKCAEFKQELFNIRFQLHTGRLENCSRINLIRRQIAQVNTIITEKLV